ncbi:MAG: right-handed parallel beta-helix repeat-containing protein, partial [Deltaproteobacteria bacterium]|nr:right-handed parallel beta-helix repeat-containing protein [Deltaproteobacteria bacterium]
MRCTPVLAAIAACVTLIVAGSASADTIKTGGNVINETWTPAGNPYVVQGDLTVPSGSFLTIQAGTIVQFASSDSQGSGLDSGRVELIVRGTLDVQGTVMAPVTMSGAASGAWYGLELDTTAASVSLANLTITNPARGVSYGATGATFSSTNLIVQSASQYGLYASAGSPTIDGFTAIAAGSAGVYVDLAGALTLTSCVLRNNGGYGIEFAPTSGARALTVTNCSINANGSYGIRTLASTAGTATITGSIITNHTAYGVARSDSSTVTTTYSDVWNNSSANFLGGTQSNNLASNPLFVSTTNLRLTSNSPARFGTSAMTDQGALPYVADATPGLYGTLWVPTTLSLAQSPFTVPGDLTVAPGVTLTIPAGVTLSFASSDLMFAGIDPGRPELQVSGALVADGTPASPIALTGTASGAWYGVELLPAAAGSLLDNVVITNPARGLSLYATGANTLSAITVQSASQYGLYAAAGSPTADAFTAIAAGSAGVYVDLAGALTLTNCVLRNNGGYGIEFAPTSGARALTVTNCSINANGSYGIRTLASTAGTVTVANSIITNHTAYGVARSDSSTVTTTYSDVWNNSSANFLGGTQSNNLASNPLFVSSTNLRLTSNSPARFGTSAMTDQGALPYVADATPGLYGT